MSPLETWPYSGRNGLGVQQQIETIFAPPEVNLNAEERAETTAFAQQLLNGTLENGQDTGQRPLNLEELSSIQAINAQHEFYLDYFRTDAGKDAYAKLGLPDNASDEELASRLTDTAYMTAAMPNKSRKDLAKKSLRWYHGYIAEALSEEPEHDTAFVNPESVKVHYEPDALLDKIAGLRTFRSFYREQNRTLTSQEDSPLRQAKQTLLDIHVARVNNMLTNIYPHAVSLAMQLDRSQPSVQVAVWTDRLRHQVPALSAALHADEPERAGRLDRLMTDFTRRLDYVRNGVAFEPEGISSISTAALSLADRLSHTEDEGSEASAMFTPDIIARMDAVSWQAPKVEEFNKAVLERWGLLSTEVVGQDAVLERTGPAADGKWQVIISNRHDSMAVDAKKKVLYIPDNFDRTLTQASPAGALAVSAHELTHVLQAECDAELSKSLPLASIKGRRYLTIKEMGGVYQERAFQQLLGRQRPAKAHYLRALSVKLAGGNRLEAARAYLNSSTAGRTLSANQLKAAQKTATTSLRLYRYGGYDTQPLDYLEQELIMQALDGYNENTKMAIAIGGGSFSLEDSAALRKVGLWQPPDSHILSPAQEVATLFQEQYLPELAP